MKTQKRIIHIDDEITDCKYTGSQIVTEINRSDRTSALIKDAFDSVRNADLMKSTRISLLEKLSAAVVAAEHDAFCNGLESGCLMTEAETAEQ